MSAMPTTAKVARPCRGGCGRHITTGPFCSACKTAENTRTFNPAYNDSRYREKRARAMSDHLRDYGYWCPGWGSQNGHPSYDLTVDHPRALARGGTHEQEFKVLCRSCNGRKGAR